MTLSRFILLVGIMMIHLNWECPPLDPSVEGVKEVIKSSENIVLADVLFTDTILDCFEFEIIEVYKGNLEVGTEQSTYYDRYSEGPVKSKGEWILSGSKEDYFELNACGFTINLNEPEIYPPLPPTIEDGILTGPTKEEVKLWEEKNENLMKLIQNVLKTEFKND